VETIDYPTRDALVAAVVDFRNQGVHVQVVHNGLTLAFPEGVNATDEDQQPETEQSAGGGQGGEPLADNGEGDSLLGVVQPEEESPLDRSTFTIEGKCSECGQAAIAEEDGSWIHVDAASHGDNNGTFVPNEQQGEGDQEDESGTEDDTEDIIGEVPANKTSKKNRNRSRSQS
jgi:hypothetical protein